MRIKRIKVEGFRCLCDFELLFEDGLTVIVGENDCGKSSLIKCINLFTGEYDLDEEDFNFSKDKIKLELEMEDFIFYKEFEKSPLKETKSYSKPSSSLIKEVETFLENYNDTTEKDKLIEYCKKVGLAIRTTNTSQTLLSNLSEVFGKLDVIIENPLFPKMQKIQFEGTQFENVNSFCKELFLKDKQNSIWEEHIADQLNLQQFIQSNLDKHSTEITKLMKEGDLMKKVSQYLPQLTDIKMVSNFEPKSLSFNSQVKFLENGQEICVDKKGDGTKRRISLALLESKLSSEEIMNLYILDEPDTHLHVKAQLELLSALKKISATSQVILTTHSPFIINSVKPKEIRLLLQSKPNETLLKTLKDEPETSDQILRRLGIENIYLYFAKKILLVEGETEEVFIPRVYERVVGNRLTQDLIKIINAKGINNIPGFSKALLELVEKDKIFVITDNDAQENTLQLIEELKIPTDRQFILGENEFEDLFSDEMLWSSWKLYLESFEKSIPTSWSVKEISKVRGTSKLNGEKFSRKLKELNQGNTKTMKKQSLGEALGDFSDLATLPQDITNLIKKIKD